MKKLFVFALFVSLVGNVMAADYTQCTAPQALSSSERNEASTPKQNAKVAKPSKVKQTGGEEKLTHSK